MQRHVDELYVESFSEDQIKVLVTNLVMLARVITVMHVSTSTLRNEYVYFTRIGKTLLTSKGKRFIKEPQIDIWLHHLKTTETLVIKYLYFKEKRRQEKFNWSTSTRSITRRM